MAKIMLLIKFDLKFGKSIKNKGARLNLGGPGLFFRKIFKKLKISIFFEKKLYLKKGFLAVFLNQFLFYPASQMKKPNKNYFGKKHVLIENLTKIIFLKYRIFKFLN